MGLAASALVRVDVTNPEDPTVVGPTYDENLDGAYGVALFGNYAYVSAENSHSLTVFNLATCADLTLSDGGEWYDGLGLSCADYDSTQGFCDSYGECTSSEGQTANEACCGCGGGQVIDPSPVIEGQVIDPSSLNGAQGVAVSELETCNADCSWLVSGRYAFVAAYAADSMTVVDVTDPQVPAVVGQVTNLIGATSVAVLGTYVYVASMTSNALTVIDVTNPQDPTVFGQIIDSTNLNGASAVAVQSSTPPFDVSGDTYAYVAAYGAAALTVIDPFSTMTPTATPTTATPTTATPTATPTTATPTTTTPTTATPTTATPTATPTATTTAATQTATLTAATQTGNPASKVQASNMSTLFVALLVIMIISC